MTTGFIYGKFPYNLEKHLVSDLSSGSTVIKCCLLLGATYTPSQGTHESYSDVLAFEHAATGNYVTGGCTCGTKTVAYDTKITTFDLDNPYWASPLTVTGIRYLCFYDGTPALAADKKLICLFDLGTSISIVASALSFSINTAGLLAMAVS